MRIYDPKKILVPIDLSEISIGVLHAAAEIAELRDAELKVLHVAHKPDYAPPIRMGAYMNEMLPNTILENSRLQLQDRIDSMLKQVSAGPNVTAMLVWGDAPEEIIRIAEKGDFDLIVMATHGRKGINRMFMGSVAEQVIRRAPCPVFVVREKVIAERDRPEVERKDQRVPELSTV